MNRRTEGKPTRALRGRAGRMQGGRGSGRASTGAVRLWGRHAVEAALKNPDRTHRKLWATREGVASLDGELPADFPVEYASPADLARLVARDAPHQGLVLECNALEDVFLEDVLDGDPARPLVILDQVTDPHNVGAIMRSAAAFNAAAIVTQDRHAPPESGTLAKSASGALEVVPWIRVVNLARALDEVAEAVRKADPSYDRRRDPNLIRPFTPGALPEWFHSTITGFWLAKRKPRKLKRLYDRREALYADLVPNRGAILIPTFLWSMGWIKEIDAQLYRMVWWALGHSSQQINVAAHISVWYLVAAVAFGAKPMSERVSRTAFLLYILFLQLASAHDAKLLAETLLSLLEGSMLVGRSVSKPLGPRRACEVFLSGLIF